MEVVDEAHATPEWLTRTLHAAGALPRGAVESVSGEVVGASWSRNVRLRLRYSPDASGERPERLFLKVCDGREAVFGPAEVHYYTRDYAGQPGAPLPRCYHAAYRESPRAYHVLLEDLSETHVDGFQVEPDLALGRALAEALAFLHAARWGPDRLAEIGAAPPGDAEIARYFGWIERGLAPLCGAAGDVLAPAERETLEAVFRWHPGAMRRRAERSDGLTWVHGDTNPGNLLVPREGAGRLLLIDRQPFDWSLQAWLGASDLAIWLVLHIDEADRRRLEQPVLRHYHRALAAHGVDHPWSALERDYRLSVAQCLEFAVEWCVLPEDRTRMRWLWERQLRRSLTAWSELDCDALLREG